MRTSPHLRKNEAGFTLIELLLAVVISGIILLALTTGVISAMRGTASAHDRMVNSNGNHTLATYFTADTQSANPDMVTLDPAAGTGCNDATLPANTTNLVRMQWFEYTTDTKVTAFSVSYRTKWTDDGDTVQELTSENDPGGSADEYQLIRYSCSISQDPFTGDVATMLAGAPLEDQMLVAELEGPSATTNTRVEWPSGSQNMTFWAYAALGKNEAPYSYSFTAAMRTPEPAPYVTSMTRTAASRTNAATVGWTVTFSEAVDPVGTDDFDLLYTGGLTGGSSPTSVAEVAGSSKRSYTVTASSGTGQGTLSIMLDDDDSIRSAAGLDTDPLGGTNPATGAGNGDFTGPGYTIDKVGPFVTVVQDSSQADPTGTAPIKFTATFNESVSSVNAASITNSGTAPVPAANITVTGSGTTWTISMTPTTGGTVIPVIAAGAASDSLGNPSSASTSGTDNSVTYNVTPAAITSVTIANGGTAQKLDQGDTITITFSGTVKASSFCSSWNGGDGATYTLDANNQVDVVVTDGTSPTHDTLRVTATGCTFNFGTLGLGTSGYVSGNKSFKGSNSDKSTIQWNGGTQTLVITLGSGGGGNPSPVPAPAAVSYTVDPALQSSTGGAINNSPFTTGTGQF